MITRSLLSVIILFLTYSLADAGKLYMWTDENGLSHISETPPPSETNSESMNYEERTGHSPPVYDYNEQLPPSIPQYKRTVTPTNSQPQSTTMDDYYQKRINRLKRDKAEYEDKLKQPHSNDDYRYYQRKILEVNEDIRRYENQPQSSTMDDYYKKRINRLKRDKAEYEDKLRQPHSNNDYRYYQRKVLEVNEDIREYEGKLK